jgi:hypothetical protein
MFQLEFTRATDQTSCSFSNSRGSNMCLWYAAGREMSDKNLEQQINITFCVKIDESTSKQ